MLSVQFKPNIILFPSFLQKLVLEDGTVYLLLAERERKVCITAFVENGRDIFRMQARSSFSIEVSCRWYRWGASKTGMLMREEI